MGYSIEQHIDHVDAVAAEAAAAATVPTSSDSIFLGCANVHHEQTSRERQ